MPGAEILSAAYDSAYYGEGRKKFPGLTGFIFDSLRLSRAKRISRLLSPGSNVLDIGYGSGVFLSGLQKLGHHCSGVELPGPAAKRAAKISGVTLYLGDLSTVSLPRGHFDFIMLWHVLEHLPQPRLALDLVVESLKANGVVTIVLPDILSWQSRIFRGRWFHIDFPRHLTFLPRSALINEMSARGFEVVYEKNYSFEYDPFGYQQSFLNCLGNGGTLLYEMMKGNTAVLPKPVGLSAFLLKLYLLFTLPLALLLSLGESMLGMGGSLELGFKRLHRDEEESVSADERWTTKG